MRVEYLTAGEALVGLGAVPPVVDVVVAESQLAAAVADAAAHVTGSTATVAHAWLSEAGPGLFAPGRCEAAEVAGFGVADPTAMLLTASLLLGEGLGRRSAARTLERAVAAVAGLNGSRPAGTRPFTDAVLERLPEARSDLELQAEVWG